MDEQISFARKLRRDQTSAERRFWVLLHPWREAGWHFRRQAPIGPFVVDFVCKRNRLVFEIDGDSHYSDEGIERDVSRTDYLRRLGYSVLRFTNDDVLGSDDGVFEVLSASLAVQFLEIWALEARNRRIEVFGEYFNRAIFLQKF